MRTLRVLTALAVLSFCAPLAIAQATAEGGAGVIRPRYESGVLTYYNQAGTAIYSINPSVPSIIRTSMTYQIGTRAKVGGTAGWTVGAANDLPYIGTVAASQTGATLVIPIDGLHIGDTITGFRIVAQVESAGATATIDAILRATTNVAAEPTDAAIGTGITQVSVTADTAVSSAKTGLTEVVTSGKTYYLLVTVTTAALTDVILQACEITVTTS